MLLDDIIINIADSYNYYKGTDPYHLYIHMRAVDGSFGDPYVK